MEREIAVKPGTDRINVLEFAGRDSLEYLEIPDTVISIGNYAFMNCYSLREIRMPAKLDSIGAGIFQNCWQLRRITIPEGVETIGSDMFENCHELAELTLPSSLKKVEKTAFSRCRSLKTIHIDPRQLDILPNSARYTAVLTFMEENAGKTEESGNGGSEASSLIDSYVSGRQNSLIDLAINRRNTEAVRYMLDHGLVSEASLDEYLRRAAESGRVEITAVLLDRLGELRKAGGTGKAVGMDKDPFA